MIFRKEGWGLGRVDGRRDGCDRACLAVMGTSSVLSFVKSQSSLGDETPRKGWMRVEFLWEDLYVGEFREDLSLHLHV